jgi:hypothetical protein
LFAFAALDEHRDEADAADGDHTENGEFQTGTADALLIKKRALGYEWIRIGHNVVARGASLYRGILFLIFSPRNFPSKNLVTC